MGSYIPEYERAKLGNIILLGMVEESWHLTPQGVKERGELEPSPLGMREEGWGLHLWV